MVTTSNSFQVLSSTNDQCQTSSANPPSNNTKNPPPIYITGVENYAALVSYLQSNSGPDSFLLKTTSKGVTIYPQTPNNYRQIVNCLKNSGAEFHTYQLPEDRNPRVVIKDLHHNTPIEEIKKDLEIYGYKIVGITNAISRFKRPLPMFFVDVSKETFNEKIFDITKLFYTKVTIEELRRKKHIPQCIRCQQYGHTRSYCNHAPRCVRCGLGHGSSTCSKTRETPAKCANCLGEHPANYRGCQTLRDLRAQRTKRNHAHQRESPPSANIRNFPDLPQPSQSPYQEQKRKQKHHQQPQQQPPVQQQKPIQKQTQPQAQELPPSSVPPNIQPSATMRGKST